MDRRYLILLLAALSVRGEAAFLHGAEDVTQRAQAEFASAPPVSTCYVGRAQGGSFTPYPSFIPVAPPTASPTLASASTSTTTAPSTIATTPAKEETIASPYTHLPSTAEGQTTSPQATGVADNSDPLVPNPQGVILTEKERALIRITNQDRLDNGLKVLAVSKTLMDQARAQTEKQRADQKMEHGNYPVRENVAMDFRGFTSALTWFTTWINSAGHRDNIRSPGSNYIGVGVDQNYATQQFA